MATCSELGEECKDSIERIYRRFFTHRGKIKEPNALLFLSLIHHVAGIMIIPMNLYYYDQPYYWEAIGLVEFAAGFGHILSEYIYLLDI